MPTPQEGTPITQDQAMLKHPKLTLDHLGRMVETRLAKRIYPQRQPLTLEAWQAPGEPVPAAAALSSQTPFTPFAMGGKWGPPWSTVWFRLSGQVPLSWSGKPVYALVSLTKGGHPGFTAEGLVYLHGKAVRAVNRYHSEVPLLEAAEGGETILFHIEAGANSAPREKNHLWPDGPPQFTFEQAELVVYDPDAWALYHDMRVCLHAIQALPENSPRRGQLLAGLNRAWNMLPITDGGDLPTDDPGLLLRLREALAPLMECRNGDSAHQVSAVGHAHIDTAWLWPLRETIRKCARTFATALRNMEAYPQYVFVCSQAVQYSWMKAHYPEIYEEIRAAIGRGQWEPVGSMWVECDCNLPSGESIVRQMLHGKRFFEEEFGYETKDVWIPDVFGYAASMPQLMKQAGVDYFLTQKISWSQFNRFPHHTFRWEGIDGTSIFTHFPPTDTYNGDFNPRQIQAGCDRFLEHDRASRSLYVYGWGDGGGGPSLDMLESARRLRDFEGLPRVTQERAREFFRLAEAEATDLPLWVGELYLELHRGTYTTQAANKRANRKCEFHLREAEMLDAISSLLLGAEGPSISGQAPPRATHDTHLHPRAEERRGRVGALDRAWKLLLLNQFHDIIPGSSIGWVYQDSTRDYEVIRTLADQVEEDSLRPICDRIDTAGAAAPCLVLNTLGFARNEVVEGPQGTPVYAEAPSCGYALLDLADCGLPEGSHPVVARVDESGAIMLENGLLRVQIGTDGLLHQVYDLWSEREVLKPGCLGNQFQIHPDLPNNWDAWDIDVFHRERMETVGGLQSLTLLEGGPLRAVVEVCRRYGNSQFRQKVVLRADSARLDFHTEADWQESGKLLKVSFPVNILSPRATFEIQFGHVERPTHMNTSWDMARFEVCAHKWVDLSEGDYGVALLNDCKYGHDVFGHTMRLSLLRSPSDPDPEADRGRHLFSYALLPHQGDPRQAGVIEEAYAFNAPLRLQPLPSRKGTLPATATWVEADRPGAIIDTVKMSEDGTDLVVRLYEAYGTRGKCELRVNLPVAAASLCDLLERPGRPLPIESGTVSLQLTPFQVATVRFRIGLPSGPS